MSEKDSKKSASSLTGMVLRAIFSTLPETLNPGAVRNLRRDSRDRLAIVETWVMDASHVKAIDQAARRDLVSLLKEFRAAHGRLLVFRSPNRIHGMVMQNLANEAGLKLQVVKSHSEYKRILDNIRLFTGE